MNYLGYYIEAIIGVISFSLYIIFVVNPIISELKSAKKDLSFYNKTYLTKQGGTRMLEDKILNYHLKSFDGGKTWYAIDDKLFFNDGTCIILGEAETVYPGLLNHLNAWDNLTKHVKVYGEIDLTNLSLQEKELMEKCNIVVKPFEPTK